MYKYANLEHTAVNDKVRGIYNIHPGVGHFWKEVEDWVAQGNVIEDFETPEEKLINAKEAKKRSIKALYADALIQPVTNQYGTFNGGEESAGAINSAVMLSDNNGETYTVITDIDNMEIKCNREQAVKIAADIGNVARQLFYKKQLKMRQIAAATTCAEVEAISW